MYSKKPRQFLPIKQSYLGALIGYKADQLWHVCQMLKQVLFPNNKKTRSSEQILRYAYLVLRPTFISTQGGYKL